MTHHQDLGDYLEKAEGKEEVREQADKDETRRRTIKRLRATGHWPMSSARAR